MTRRLNFNFEVDKFVHAAAFLTESCPGVTKMKLAKLLYFADKKHLVEYGRPVTGDRYTKMELGPAPCDQPSRVTKARRWGRKR